MSKHSNGGEKKPFSSAAALLLGALICAAAWLVQYRLMPQTTTKEVSSSPFAVARLNEVMSANKSVVMDDEGAYSDWIEIYNPSAQSVDITGWKLSDGEALFTFPSCALESGEAVLVFASGRARALPGQAYHAPFRLSSSGETITLADAAERVVDEVTLPALEANRSYALGEDGQWKVTAQYTPGLKNDAEYVRQSSALPPSGIMINEVAPDNVSLLPDGDGDFSDYIEIANLSGRSVSLAGWGLSDDEASPGKWLFPDVTLSSGEYLIVFASGKNYSALPGEMHAPFRLSASGESVLLTSPSGQVEDLFSYDEVAADEIWSRDAGGQWVNTLPATPGYPNSPDGAARADSALRARNATQIFINEVLHSTRAILEGKTSWDWAELYNASNQVVDLSGWGLSDNAARPRKWQFPEGATIGPGQYLVVALSGRDGQYDGRYHTSFKLSRAEGEALVLSTPGGTIVDRTPAVQVWADISIGRAPGQSGFSFFPTPTPGAANTSAAYVGRAHEVAFSVTGGVQSESFMLELSAGEGERIYYTTDCTLPTAATAAPYTGPIPISATTVVRAVACRGNYIDSMPATHTYLFGVNHTLPVVSLVATPDDLFGQNNGILSNYTQAWSRDAHIEYFTTASNTLFSQGVEISLHGNDAREQNQKTFNVIARSAYGDNRIRAALFPNRDYTEYQSILLRPSSEDSVYTRMRCSILSELCMDTTVMYQDTDVAVLYINGQYWGHYNLRERINAYSIAQWEGWSDPSRVNIVKSNDSVKQGSNRTYKELLEWLKDHPLTSQENLDYVNTVVDVENYLDYVMVEMYAANSDLMNLKRYMSEEGDGRWKWTVFDLDWAFYVDKDSWSDWLGSKGAGIRNATDNTLFRKLMENAQVKEDFLRLLGRRLATCWRSEVIVQKIDARQALLEPEMPANYARWNGSVDRWRTKVADFRQYALSRPAKLIGYIAEAERLTPQQIEDYFGEALKVNPAPAQ